MLGRGRNDKRSLGEGEGDKTNVVEIDDPQKPLEPNRDKQEATVKLMPNEQFLLGDSSIAVC
ncbi:hypothetical protein C4D60_Mb01t32250 [Musa balbisiana]|uniref:Uncharacterized protein n=1 Tax=Musa balbisiana TaxID=52838 RepID=A0A4S8JS95_MUSBA|nr:hypothetical protein C4D60_Mb01t32250 [Musa balbisiana]